VPCDDAVITATVDSPKSCCSTPRVTSTVWMREIGTSVQVRVSQPVSVYTASPVTSQRCTRKRIHGRMPIATTA
jgi:hypothetical protein